MRPSRLLCLTLAAGLAACDGDRPEEDTLAMDSTLARDLALAGGDSLPSVFADTARTDSLTLRDSVIQPSIIVPAPAAEPAPPRRTVTPAPRPRPRPAPRPTPDPEPVRTPGGNTVRPGTGVAERVATIPSGTTLVAASTSRVCTNTHRVGDRITARLAEGVYADGASIPAGATVTLEITRLERSENANDPIRVSLAPRTLSTGGTSHALDASVTDATVERVRSSTREKDLQKVIGGAVVGAIAGQILGKDTRSTVIGAATGAAAGTGVAAATANFEGCLPSEGRIVMRLDAPLTIALR